MLVVDVDVTQTLYAMVLQYASMVLRVPVLEYRQQHSGTTLKVKSVIQVPRTWHTDLN